MKFLVAEQETKLKIIGVKVSICVQCRRLAWKMVVLAETIYLQHLYTKTYVLESCVLLSVKQ